ncbi:right-handed parallel beta-helix repeat-containing protein [Candidatus Peregrinibacteria bacterium]|nr:right-handed parallel beta-helix repeat-containing protein [Candidatus Peregrinibacteria bacterium]
MKTNKKITFAILLILFFVFSEPLFQPFLNIAQAATTYYVNVNTGSNGNNGSQGSPWKTITFGLTQIASGDTISVAAGTYNTASGETFPLRPSSGATLTGAGATTTIVSGSGNTFDMRGDTTVSDVTISGFTITTDSGQVGHGVELLNVNNIIIQDNIIRNNGNDGINLWKNADNVTIRRNFIYSNAIDGIQVGSDDVSLINDGLTISNNVIYRNTTDGIWINPSTSATLVNNTIFSNPGIGIGIGSFVASTVTATNNIISNNATGLTKSSNTTLTNTYNNIVSNSTNYSGGASAGTGDISSDPKYISTTSGSENFRLQTSSPSINTGTTSSVTNDIVGNTRPYGSSYDMGAYENDNIAPSISNQSPASGATNVAQNANISFRLTDADSGLDTSQISLTVGGVSVTPTVTAVSAPNIYDVTYDPSSNFAANSLITVVVGAQDLWSTPNTASSSWSFTVINPDSSPPVISSQSPAINATSVSSTAVVTFRLTDAGTGINTSSISMQFDGLAVTPTITAITVPTIYDVSYDPPGSMSVGTHTATLVVDDTVTTANRLSTSWSFTVSSTEQTTYGGGGGGGSNSSGTSSSVETPAIDTPDQKVTIKNPQSSDTTSPESTSSSDVTPSAITTTPELTPSIEVTTAPKTTSSPEITTQETATTKKSTTEKMTENTSTSSQVTEWPSQTFDIKKFQDVIVSEEEPAREASTSFSPKKLEAAQKIYRNLDTINIKEARFTYEPLAKIVEFLKNATNIDIKVNADIADEVVSIRIKNALLPDVLNNIREKIDNVDWAINEDFILIASSDYFSNHYYKNIDFSVDEAVTLDKPWIHIILNYNPSCGNGIIDSTETCDDGNTESEDGCSNICSEEVVEGSEENSDENPSTTETTPTQQETPQESSQPSEETSTPSQETSPSPESTGGGAPASSSDSQTTSGSSTTSETNENQILIPSSETSSAEETSGINEEKNVVEQENTQSTGAGENSPQTEEMVVSSVGIETIVQAVGGGSPENKCDLYSGTTDADKDGLSDRSECLIGTDQNKIDTDNDGYQDSEEFLDYNTDPKNIKSLPKIVQTEGQSTENTSSEGELDITPPVSMIPYFTNLRNGDIIADNTPVIQGVAEPNSTVSIQLKNEEGQIFDLGTYQVTNKGKFLFEIVNGLLDGEYRIIARYSDSSQVTSKEISFIINTTLDITAPKLTRLSGKQIISGRHLTINDLRPYLMGVADYNSVVVLHWKSAIFSSSLIADSLEGTFSNISPQELEQGDHTIWAYAIRSKDNVRSPDIKIEFTIQEPSALFSPRWIVPFTIVLTATLAIATIMRQRSKPKLRLRAIKK